MLIIKKQAKRSFRFKQKSNGFSDKQSPIFQTNIFPDKGLKAIGVIWFTLVVYDKNEASFLIKGF